MRSRQKVCSYILVVMLLRCLPSLEGKLEYFDTKEMFINTRSSAAKMFAKFGRQTRTFCHKRTEKEVAKLESNRL